MNRTHLYQLHLEWTGNNGTGTSSYRSYERSYSMSANGKPVIYGSADANFRGDAAKYNPEDLLVMALSSCHLLSYLHACADAGIVVVSYTDEAVGTMTEDREKGGFFTEVVLHPRVAITDNAKRDLANALHEKAHHMCFISNSVNFPVRHEATCEVAL